MGSELRRSRWVRGGVAALASSLALACGSDEPTTTGSAMTAPAETAAPVVSEEEPLVVEHVTLSADAPLAGDTVEARPTLVGGAREGVRFEYQWSVGGVRQDAEGSRLLVQADTGRGASIEVLVVAVAGDRRSAPVRASARVGNAPPVLQGIVIEPSDGVVAGQSITATPRAFDPDRDDLDFDYRWDVNEQTVLRDEPILPAFHFKRGDRIRLTVSASDGIDSSNEIQSVPIEVGNAVPSIVSTPGALDTLGRFTYELDVEDADGDEAFSYRLVQGPPGMSMDPVDGTVRWEPRPEQTGQHPVRIEVADRQGGTASQSFVMTIGEEEAPPADEAP